MKTQDIVDTYYAALQPGGDPGAVPFADALVFRGPSGMTEGAAGFRAMLGGLAQNVKQLDMRHQLSAKDCVLSVYDLDMGAPGGPIPMAERLRIDGDRIAEVELFFDTKRLGG